MSGHAQSAPAGAGDGSGDPSMEDILASIRRILSEDEGQAPPAEPPAAVAMPASGVLELDASMLVEQESENEATMPPLPGPEQLPTLHADRSSEPPPAPPPAATADRTDMTDLVPDTHAAAPTPHQSLVAPEAAAAAASSVGSLLRSIGTRQTVAVRGGGPTIEDLVRDELRPALKAWLDVNLPPLVERLVRAEIERVVGRVDL